MRFHLQLLLALLIVSCASNDNKPSPKKQADLFYEHGTTELMNKNYTQAIAKLLKAVELDNQNPEIHNNLGMAYYFKGEKGQAFEHIKKALELDPKNADARVNLASLLFERSDLAGAEQHYKHALKDLTYEKHARTYYNLALIELRRNRIQSAKSYLITSTNEDRDYCPAWLQLGQINLKERNLKEAAKNFHESRMGLCANSPAPLYWQAVADAELGNYLAARMKLDELQTKFSNTPYASMAQQKLTEITLMENQPETKRAKALETPAF